MDWTLDQLNKRVKIYNRIYFNNEIKYPIEVKWSRQLFNVGSRQNANCRFYNGKHTITFNVTYKNVSDEMMRSTLVHEMIHAWQFEHDDTMYDDWSKMQGHRTSIYSKM